MAILDCLYANRLLTLRGGPKLRKCDVTCARDMPAQRNFSLPVSDKYGKHIYTLQ